MIPVGLNSSPDYTAATILETFRNEAAALSMERILKNLTIAKAQSILAVVTRHFCQHFISC